MARYLIDFKRINNDIMETPVKSDEILNDLIKINAARIAGFEHATKKLNEKDVDLKKIFGKYREESRNNIKELKTEVNQIRGHSATATSISGSLNRVWLDVKANFFGQDRKSILIACKRIEYSVKRAYHEILSKENNLSTNLKKLLSTQEVGIFIAHDKIRNLYDRAA